MPPAKKPTKTVVKTKKNPDGSQQYVRGNTPMERVNTLSRSQNEAYAQVTRAYREGDKARSNKILSGAVSLDKAQQVEAAAELRRRRNTRSKKKP